MWISTLNPSGDADLIGIAHRSLGEYQNKVLIDKKMGCKTSGSQMKLLASALMLPCR